MRPPEFTGGNSFDDEFTIDVELDASMRPPEFTGGNLRSYRGPMTRKGKPLQ